MIKTYIINLKTIINLYHTIPYYPPYFIDDNSKVFHLFFLYYTKIYIHDICDISLSNILTV